MAKAVKALDPDIQALYGVANGAFDDENFPKDAGEAGTDVLSANYHYNAVNQETQDIRKRFEEEYDAPMQTASVLSYQAVELIAQALEESDSADPADLREAHLGDLRRGPAARLRRTDRVRRDRAEHQRDRGGHAGPG